jgi:hypothetical protein
VDGKLLTSSRGSPKIGEDTRRIVEEYALTE